MEIVNLKRLGKGKIQAVFDLKTPKLTICGCKLLEGNDGQLWAAMPSHEFMGKDGRKKYSPMIILDPDLQTRVTELARAAFSQK